MCNLLPDGGKLLFFGLTFLHFLSHLYTELYVFSFMCWFCVKGNKMSGIFSGFVRGFFLFLFFSGVLFADSREEFAELLRNSLTDGQINLVQQIHLECGSSYAHVRSNLNCNNQLLSSKSTVNLSLQQEDFSPLLRSFLQPFSLGLSGRFFGFFEAGSEQIMLLVTENQQRAKAEEKYLRDYAIKKGLQVDGVVNKGNLSGVSDGGLLLMSSLKSMGDDLSTIMSCLSELKERNIAIMTAEEGFQLGQTEAARKMVSLRSFKNLQINFFGQNPNITKFVTGISEFLKIFEGKWFYFDHEAIAEKLGRHYSKKRRQFFLRLKQAVLRPEVRVELLATLFKIGLFVIEAENGVYRLSLNESLADFDVSPLILILENLNVIDEQEGELWREKFQSAFSDIYLQKKWQNILRFIEYGASVRHRNGRIFNAESNLVFKGKVLHMVFSCSPSLSVRSNFSYEPLPVEFPTNEAEWINVDSIVDMMGYFKKWRSKKYALRKKTAGVKNRTKRVPSLFKQKNSTK